MTESSAQKLANVLIGAAVVGAAYYVVKTPPLRRLAWRLMMIAATGSVPGWLRQEIQQGWEASARPVRIGRPDLHVSAHEMRAGEPGLRRDPRASPVEG